jgi:hypothetical protein
VLTDFSVTATSKPILATIPTTITPAFTQKSTLIPTRTIADTIAQIETPLPMPSYTPTVRVVDFDALPPLSQVILTVDDIQANYSAEISYTIFYREPKPTENDLTKNLGDKCLLDCVRKAWYSGNTSTSTITLIREVDWNAAKDVVQELSTEYSNTNTSVYEWKDDGFRARNENFGLPNHTYIASGNPASYYLVSNRGSVVIIITDEFVIKPGVTDIDTWSHALSLQFLAKLQNEKLLAAGYP